MPVELIAILVFGYVLFAIARGAARSGKRALERAGSTTGTDEPSAADLAEMLARELGITVDTEGGVRVRPVQEQLALSAGEEERDAWEAFDSEDDLPDDETRLLPSLASRPQPPARIAASAPLAVARPKPVARRERRHGHGRRSEDAPLSPERLHDRRTLRRAVILAEVLGKPKALEE